MANAITKDELEDILSSALSLALKFSRTRSVWTVSLGAMRLFNDAFYLGIGTANKRL